MTDQKAELEMKTLYQITGNAADINTILINRGEFRNLRARVAELEAQLESIGAGGVGPLMAPVKQAQQVAAQKDAVFEASIDFIGTLTGMKPPPIETAPPEIFEPFRNFTERVCSIFRQPLPKDQIREILMANGFTIKDGMSDLKPYVYDTVYAILSAHGIWGEA